MNMDWQSNESHLILNPRLPEKDICLYQVLPKFSQEFDAHIWLATSGSVQTKFVALHKNALLASAQAVNKHLQATIQDIWINPLPSFHVGGLGIWARAHLNGATVHAFTEKWSPSKFLEFVSQKKGTLTALVPTQVYDIVLQKYAAPKSLRAVIVGGGELPQSVYSQARQLGWPLLPSYGMTECSSQIATATLNSLCEKKFPSLEILSHMHIKINEENRISLFSPALFSTYAMIENEKICLSCPKENGWFQSQDIGSISDQTLSLLGRLGDFIKIGGENVNFGCLEKILEEIKLQNQICFDIALLAMPDARLGHIIHLVSTEASIEIIQKLFNSKAMPYERIREVHIISKIPRSPLNKVLKNELIKLIKTEACSLTQGI